MGPEILLPIALKLKQMYQNVLKQDNKENERFLLLPSQWRYFRYEDLDFADFSAGTEVKEQVFERYEFAIYTNTICEEGSSFELNPDRLLWNEFKRLISECITASSLILSSDESKELENIETFLNSPVNTTDFGTTTIISAYNSINSKISSVRALYFSEKNQFEVEIVDPNDPDWIERKKLWDNFEKKEIMQEILTWENKLVQEGKKAEVETKLALKESIYKRNGFATLRQELKSKLEDFSLSVPDTLMDYFYTDYSPPVFKENEPWYKISLTKNEINSLLNQMPDTLKNTHSNEIMILKQQEDIESLTFEYNHSKVIRGWFSFDFLKSKYWKTSQSTIVSDGNIPSKGLIPSYVDKIYAVRKVNVTRKKKSESGPAIMTGPKILVFPKPVKREISPSKRIVSDLRVFGKPVFHVKKKEPKEAMVKVIDWRKTNMAINPKVNKGVMFNPTLVEQVQSNKTELINEEYKIEDVVIVAVECKRIPKSPDPDPSLKWD